MDEIDLTAAVIHNSPDVRAWPVKVNIAMVTETPERGFILAFDRIVPESWKWPSNPAIPSDNFQFTVWFFARLAGIWHGAGLIQMWDGRFDTGHPVPPLLTTPPGDTDLGYVNLWGDHRRLWGELSDYVPKVGDEMAIMITAGNARMFPGVSSVAERSQVVRFTVTPGDTFRLMVPADAGGGTGSGGTGGGEVIPPAGSDIAAILAKLQELEDRGTTERGADRDVVLAAIRAAYTATVNAIQAKDASAAPTYDGSVTVPWIGTLKITLTPRAK